MTGTTKGAEAPPAANAAQKFYLTAWRWHFYAGLYVIPFMVMLAVTGLIMLWISWLVGTGAERMAVEPEGIPLSVSVLQAAAEAAVPGGSITQYIEPLAPDRVASFVVAGSDAAIGVAVNPYTAEIVRTFPWGAGWYQFASKVHGTLLMGNFGDLLIEIAASLGIVMIVSGLYLHWPRGGSGWRAALLPRVSAKGRAFWKSLHGVVGFWMSGVLVVFLISGLSWAGVWGGQFVQPWSTFPAEKWNVPVSEEEVHASMNHGSEKEVPWGLEQTPMPISGLRAGQPAVDGEVNLKEITAFARSLEFPGRFQIRLPQGEAGVWTISHDSMSNDGDDPTADRTLHIDRFTGHVLADVRYADYSIYARAMAWGIAFHEGDLGVWNLVFNTVFCLSVIGLSLSGMVMWWKRRPEGARHIVAPPKPRDMPFWKGATALVVLLGLMFPMAGIAIALILLIDVAVLRLMPGLKRALS